MKSGIFKGEGALGTAAASCAISLPTVVTLAVSAVVGFIIDVTEEIVASLAVSKTIAEARKATVAVGDDNSTGTKKTPARLLPEVVAAGAAAQVVPVAKRDIAAGATHPFPAVTVATAHATALPVAKTATRVVAIPGISESAIFAITCLMCRLCGIDKILLAKLVIFALRKELGKGHGECVQGGSCRVLIFGIAVHTEVEGHDHERIYMIVCDLHHRQ